MALLRLPAALLPALLLLQPALSCSFARSGLQDSAPTVPYLGHNSSAFPLGSIVDGSWVYVDTIANLSGQLGRELCYVSMQVLPPPPTGFNPASGQCSPSPCSWSTPPSLPDAQAVLLLASAAMSRMQPLLSAEGPMLSSFCSTGAVTRGVLCEQAGGPLCNASFLNSSILWPVASNVFKITPATAAAFKASILQWRTSAALHRDTIDSPQTREGWGAGGAVTAKVLPCSDIPQQWLSRPAEQFVCDAMGQAGPLLDEVKAWWDGACDLLLPGTTAPCL
jgi:hypothetical protein